MLPTEPQSIGGILDAGFRIYRQTFKSAVVPAAVCGVAMAVLSIFMLQFVNIEAMTGNPEAAAEFLMAPGFWIYILLYVLTILIFFLSVMNRQWTLTQGQTPSLATDLGTAAKLAVPVAIAALIYYVCLVIGMILLIVPGLILMVSMGLFIVVPIVEGRGAMTAPFRSHRLVWGGSWWRTTGVFTVLMVVTVAISLLFQLILGGVSGMETLVEPQQPSMLSNLGGVVLAVLIYPLTTAVLLAMYNDARLRKEGGDLDTKLAALNEA